MEIIKINNQKNMSGHSKWSTIKHQKAITDIRKGKIFSKMSRLISIAAKNGGENPNDNPNLRLTIEKAHSLNMPKEKIERAIKRGVGKLEGEKIEEVIYEAYCPFGIALIIKTITDNKNRTLSEIRHILSKHQAKLAKSGSVKYLFEKKEDKWMPKYPININDENNKEQLKKLFDELSEQNDVQEIFNNIE